MTARPPSRPVKRRPMRPLLLLVAGLFLTLPLSPVFAGAPDAVADRLAVERVYYNHRLGDKPPFEQAMPREAAEKLVRQERHKEAVLKQVYGVEITPAQIEVEIQRINATTRAPEVLADLKAVLGNDPVRFAQTVAKPILVERELRLRFDNDDQLHAPQRTQADQLRNQLLDAKQKAAGCGELLALMKQNKDGVVTEITWQFGARPPEISPPDDAKLKKHFRPDAHVLSPPADAQERTFYFEELPRDLQNVLRVQLGQADDVSAVIETPGAFLVFLATDKTATTLSVAVLSTPKRSYEQWLSERDEEIAP
jgi:hypothetical protein